MTPFRQARRRLLEAELARRLPKASSVFEPLADCTEPQRRLLLDSADQRAVCTTRRAGKTSGFVRDATKKSWENPNASVIYLNETRDRAKRTFWEELKNYVRAARLPYVANEAELFLRGPQNRWIFVGGGESKKQINRWKGILPKAAAFILDECQDWRPEVLRHAYAEVIAPALADMGGQFTAGGVPGPLPDAEDTWFDWSHSAEFSQHGGEERPWTLWDNPHVKNARQLLDRVMRTRGVDESDPTIQREFFGRWVRDTAVLVFGALDDELNAYDPPPPEGDWSFVGGADGGYVDEAALAMLGWATKVDPHIFVTKSEKFSHRGAYETIDRMKTFFGEPGPRLWGIAADPAAGMKNIAHDLWERHGLHVEPAQKEDKVGGVKLLAGSIAAREFLIPRAHPLFRSLRRVQWDPDHRGEKLRGHTPDDVDAVIYAFRKAYPLFTFRPPPPPLSYEEERLQRIVAAQGAGPDDGWS